MKQHFIRLLTFIVWLLASLGVARAQNGLAINKLYEDMRLRNMADVREVYLSGNSLKDYDFSFFHSLMVSDDARIVGRMEKAATADSRLASDIKRIVKGDVLVALYMQLPPAPDSALQRFVLFRRKDSECAMLIYIEGNTTLDNIIKVQYK